MGEVIIVVLVVGALGFFVYKLRERKKAEGRGGPVDRPGSEQK